MLRQVDDLMIQTDNEAIAKVIFKIIGLKLQLKNETEPPFAYLGLTTDFNGVDIEQSKTHIIISCGNYIDRMVQAHKWEKLPNKVCDTTTKTPSPLPDKCLNVIFSVDGPDEHTPAAIKLEQEYGFAYRTLLGEMMYAYVTCRPDIGYAITTMSNFSTKPSAKHYELLKGIGKYFRLTKDWGIKFKRTIPDPTLEDTKFETNVELPSNLPDYTVDINQPKLIAFVDESYANDPRKQRSTTVFVFTYCGGAIVYRSKSQSITALSSTEAEFLAAVS